MNPHIVPHPWLHYMCTQKLGNHTALGCGATPAEAYEQCTKVFQERIIDSAKAKHNDK